MNGWWLLPICLIVIGYPVILVRGALRRRQWALDTLEALRYVGGDLTSTSAWLAIRPHPEVAPDAVDGPPPWLEA